MGTASLFANVYCCCDQYELCFSWAFIFCGSERRDGCVFHCQSPL